jgi:hypothetical protein
MRTHCSEAMSVFRHNAVNDDQADAAREQGARLAGRVIEEYATRDVFEIADRAGVRIAYERWPVVTIGECEPRAAIIRLNLNALERVRSAGKIERAIIAHELGHFFAARFGIEVDREEGELVAFSFAENLIYEAIAPVDWL